MKTLALFNNQKQTSSAIDAITQSNLGDKVNIEIVEAVSPTKQAAGVDLAWQAAKVLPVAPTSSGGTVPAMGVLTGQEETLAALDLSEEKEAFLKRSVHDGGQLVRVDTETLYQPQVETILRQHDAQIVHTTGWSK